MLAERILAEYTAALDALQEAAARTLSAHRLRPTAESGPVLLAIAQALRTTTHHRGRLIRHPTPSVT